jgi:hypothetical protein
MPLSSPFFLYSYESAYAKTYQRQSKVERLKPLISLPGILMMFKGKINKIAIIIFNCFKHQNENNIYLITYTQ